jgi:predicted N-acyltransferase
LCGSRRPGHTRLLLRPELDEATRRELARQALHEAEALAHERGVASLSFLYVDEDDRLLRDALIESDYLEFPSATAARLDVPLDFDGYLQRFERERRRTIQKERKKLAAAGIAYRALPLTEELIETILPQELALYDRYGTEFPAADAARLHRSVAALLGERVQVLTAQQDGQIRGFVVCIRWRNTLFGRQVGFDYAFQGRLPLYFGLGYYALVEYAAAQGVRHIEYGIGSERAKALRGCALRQQYGYVKALTPAGHTAVERALEELRG